MAKQQLTQEQKQTQRLSTEQQRMLGMMLEKNDAEMGEYIDNKVTENPALEKKNEDEDDKYYNNSDDESNDSPAADDAQDQPADDASTNGNVDVPSKPTSDDYPEMNNDDDSDNWLGYIANNSSADDEYYSPQDVSQKSLQEYLMDQLGELDLDELQQIIATTIVGSLDDNGYLRSSVSKIADDLAFNEGKIVDKGHVEQVLGIVQSLDPPGIAARDLKECILLQLHRKPVTEDVKIAIEMIEKHFNDLGRRIPLNELARKMGLPTSRVTHVLMSQVRKGVTPFPAGAYSSQVDVSQQVTADFDVEIDEESERLIVTLRNKIPELQISESYTMMNERFKSGMPLSERDKKDKRRIIDAYQRASMFIDVLKQRQETLFKTMSAIVQCQKEYFLSGDERKLKPLGQQQIADMIGKDVSVVSRAVNNKYVQTRWGVKSLKFFFSEDINGDSRHEVYDELKKLIDQEDKKHPLSDDALCELLKAKGYTLERRTVAKYRGVLDIPSSTIRRKMAL